MFSFTVSQTGMVRLWEPHCHHRRPGKHWRRRRPPSKPKAGCGGKRLSTAQALSSTFVVLLVLIATKFVEGAWVIVLMIPLLIMLFRQIKQHYVTVAQKLRTREITSAELAEIADVVIVPIADVHRGTLRALKYAKRLSKHVRVVNILTDPARTSAHAEALGTLW